jgi:hypothetical protein
MVALAVAVLASDGRCCTGPRRCERKLINVQRSFPFILKLGADFTYIFIPRRKFPAVGIEAG